MYNRELSLSEKIQQAGLNEDEYIETYTRIDPDLKAIIKIVGMFLFLEKAILSKEKFFSAEEICLELNKRITQKDQQYNIKQVQSLIVTINNIHGPLFIKQFQDNIVQYKISNFYG